MSNPTITLSAGTAPTEGGAIGSYLITLDTPAPVGGLTVYYNTTGSTATLYDDYNFTLGANLTAVTTNSFTIAAGATTATLNLLANADVVTDPNETVTLNLTTGAGYQLAQSEVTTFTSGGDYAVSIPVDIAVGDFNNDGKLDLATPGVSWEPSNWESGHNGNSKVSVLSANATGFDTTIDYSVGDYPWRVCTGDFNNDGKLDLAVANGNDRTISVLLRNADNTGFDAETDYAVNGGLFISAGDFNNDGKCDLAATSWSDTGSVTVLLRNAANDGFDKTSYLTGSAPGTMAVGDFNNDSRLDLAVANYYSNSVSVLLGNATGFNAKVDYATGAGPYSIAVGDFNNDGKLDLVTTNFDGLKGNTVSVLLGNATGFNDKTDYVTEVSPYSAYWVSVGDFNNDNKDDLAVVNVNSSGGGTVSVLSRNAANDGFDTTVVMNGDPYAVSTGDFNNDGKLDLAVANASDRISILLNDSNPTATLTIADSNTAPVAVNAIGHWMAEDNANDSSPTANNGVFSGNYVNGINGKAFDLSTGKVYIPDIPAYTSGSDFTVGFWFNMNGETSGVFLGQDGGPGGYNKWFIDYGIYNPDGFNLHINGFSRAFLPSNPASLTSNWNQSLAFLPSDPISQPSGWNQLTLVKNDNDYRFYFNGIDIGSQTFNGIFPDPVYNLTFGYAEPNHQFSGLMDEVVMYNRALTAGEVAALVSHTGNTAPVAVNDVLTATEDTTVTYLAANLLDNDTDAEGNQLIITSVTNGIGGTVMLNPDSSITFTPNENFNGEANFTYQVSDGLLNSNSATVTVNVAAVNDAPVLTAFSDTVATGNEDSQVTISFTDLQTKGDEADIDGAVNVFVVKTVSTGTLKIGLSASTATAWNAINNTVDATHQAYWTPDANANGTLNAFTVVAKDDGGLESATLVQATVSMVAVPDVNVTAGVTSVEGGTKGTFIITLDSPAPVGGLTVNYTLAGTATLATDYTMTAGSHVTAVTGSSFTIAAGESSAVLKVKAVNDAVFDPDETVTLNLAGGTDYQLFQGATFSPEGSYETGINPRSVSAGDFNNDGRLDLAVANADSNTVSVLLRNAANTGFDAKVNYATGIDPRSVSVGDFNNDGKADLVVANRVSDTVSVLLGNTTGFDDKVDYATGLMPASVSVGDFNNDGKADLAVANSDSNTVSVLLRNAANTGFDESVYTTGERPLSVDVGDFNNDGKLDLATANQGSYSVSVLLRNAANTGFDTPVDYPVSGAATSVSVADFNNDGKADLAALFAESHAVTVLLRNTANTGFDAPDEYSTGGYPASVSAGDFNNDGKADLAIANLSGGTLSVLLRNAANTGFDTPDEYSTGGTSVSTGDFNNDGKVDLATTNSYSGTVSVLLNNSAFSATLTITDPNNPHIYHGHSYFLTDPNLTWQQAQAQAASFGGNLVTINNQAEQTWLTNTFANASSDLGSEWIGYTDQNTEGVFKWISGEHSTFTNWDSGEPNNLGNEDYAQMYSKAYHYGRWSDVNASNNGNGLLRGIIEINSTLVGTSGNDTIKGTRNDDLISGLAGADTMQGGKGDDSYYVDNAGDVVKEYAHQGKDTVYSTVSYALSPNVENLVLIGSEALIGRGNVLDNHLTGNSADNYLNGEAGADSMWGGKGNDSYYVDNVGDVVKEYAHQGDDTVYSAISYTLTSNVENLVLIGSEALIGNGNALDNHLTGNSADNILDGKGGADIMEGGKGNDSYYVDNETDKIVESALNGWDSVLSTTNRTLEANIEELYLLGTAHLNGYGNNQNNNLNGNAGSNILDGGAGADLMRGGAGADIYYVDNVGDVIKENADQGYDSVYATVSHTLAANIEDLYLNSWLTAINGTGNKQDNRIIGNDAANIINGRAGTDILYGEGGEDTIYGGSGADTIFGDSFSSGGMFIGSDNDTLYGDDGNDILIGGHHADTLYGGAGDDTLYGGWGAGDDDTSIDNLGGSRDTLYGEAGNDTLMGNGGADTLIGGLGKDNYNLEETIFPATDTLRIAKGDSLVSGYDVATDFKLGTGVVSTEGVDLLDLDSSSIATNAAAVNGSNSGNIKSHHISNGIISFDNVNSYTDPLAITEANLSNVFSYLQANITGHNTVAFVSDGNTFVFQDGGVTDTLVELVGVVAGSVNTTGLATNAVWIV